MKLSRSVYFQHFEFCQKLPWIYLFAFRSELVRQLLSDGETCLIEDEFADRAALGILRIRTMLKFLFGYCPITNDVHANTVRNLEHMSDDEPAVIEV